LAERLQSTRSKYDSRTESLEQKREQLAETKEGLANIETQLEQAKQERTDDHSAVSKAIEETRVALETKRRERERLEQRRSTLADRRDERDRKQEQLNDLSAEIRDLTSRIENLESDLRETFNDAIDDLLAVLQFEDIERMWLDGNFELVVAREVEGAVREDSIENLAESERGMIGLVLGLAGYLSYDIDTVSPVLVVDSLGAFDAERADRLLEYFGEHVAYLVAAVHPEQVAEAETGQTAPAPGQ
jgi:DNA repair exonuclease SbcCD ATPase subunit